MATKTFSSRVDESKLDFADALARKEYGISFGQYCGTILLDSIEKMGCMPALEPLGECQDKKLQALSYIKGFSEKIRNPKIANLSDDEIKDLIASRYE